MITLILLAMLSSWIVGCCLHHVMYLSPRLCRCPLASDIVLKQHEVGKWSQCPSAGASSLPVSVDVPEPLQLSETVRLSGTTHRPATRLLTAQQGSSSAAIVPSHGVEHRSHPEEALEWTGNVLGAGQCGYVVEGR